MKDYCLRVKENKRLNGEYFSIIFEAGDFECCAPGQFVNLKVCEQDEVLLRRPFSICGFEDEQLRIVYKVIGKGTKLLTKIDAGDTLQVLGPLGNGFPNNGGSALLVGGGVGVPPLRFLGTRLQQQDCEIVSCLGFRSREDVILQDEFQAFSSELLIATDDGSFGIGGNVIDALNTMEGPLPQVVYCCGPKAMMRAVKVWAATQEIDCYLSLEENMGCGYGVCLSCAAHSVQGGYVRICKEGPVFAAEDVDF